MPGETPEDVTMQRVTVQREFQIEQMEEGDGRTVHARIVPYNTVARVADPPSYTPYDELWLPGVFQRQTKAADKVKILANFEHEPGIAGVVGHGVSLADEDDGLYGAFRMHETDAGEKTLHLIREDVIDGVSLEAVVLRSRFRQESGVMERVRAHLDKVAFCRMAAFEDAKVLAVRSGEPDDEEPKPQAVDLSATDPEVDRRLEQLGYQPIELLGFTVAEWSNDHSRFTDEQFTAACLVDRGNQFVGHTKMRYALPILEPDGTLNVNAALDAQRSISRNTIGHVTSEQRKDAARKLIRYMRAANLAPERNLVDIASR